MSDWQDVLKQFGGIESHYHVSHREMAEEILKLRKQLEIAVVDLTSISKNRCCDMCQEAKLVAIKTLSKIEALNG